MSGHIFPREHFATVRKLGVRRFVDPETEIIGELALTLPKLHDNNAVIGFNIDELASYHMLHYGANRVDVEEAIDIIDEGNINDAWLMHLPGHSASKVKSLRQTLKDGLEAGKCEGGMALGRIAVNLHQQIPDELKEFTNEVHIPRIDADSPAIRTERFLYPRPGVVLSYMGEVRHPDSIDFLTRYHPAVRDYSEQTLASDVYFDTVKVLTRDTRESFLTVSSLSEVGVIAPYWNEED